jgi:hypothetical protein
VHCAIAYEAGLGSSSIGEIAWQGVVQNRAALDGRPYTFQSKSPPRPCPAEKPTTKTGTDSEAVPLLSDFGNSQIGM